MSSPTIAKVKRHPGIAGQYAISAEVTYPDEEASTVSFVANVHGGPVVMATPTSQIFVSRDVTDRLGSKVDETWVRRFFEESPA